MSAVELDQPGVAGRVRDEVAAAGVAPSSLVVEVTETVLLSDTPVVAANLDGLIDQGIGMALDDFGTAYASLEYLLRHPFDHIKLDRSFTSALSTGARTVELVHAIRRLAGSVGAVAVAEGVEEPRQRELLLAAGWQLAQGYLFSPPVPRAEADRVVERGVTGTEP